MSGTHNDSIDRGRVQRDDRSARSTNADAYCGDHRIDQRVNLQKVFEQGPDLISKSGLTFSSSLGK